MTWCSENSTGFRLASSAIHCRFVDRFAGSKVPSRVSRQWLSSRGASLPSGGSRRARFPALSGTMKALRLPIRVSAVAYLFRSRRPRLPPSFVFAAALPEAWRVLPGQGSWSSGAPNNPARLTWTRMGSLRSSGDPSRAFAPFQDPGRTDVSLPLTATPVLPPLSGRRRLRHWLISGLTAASALAAIRFTRDVAAHVQGSLPAGRLGLYRMGVEPTGSLREVSAHLVIILLSCPPDATGFRSAHPGYACSPPAAVGLKVLKIVAGDRLAERAQTLGARLATGLRDL